MLNSISDFDIVLVMKSACQIEDNYTRTEEVYTTNPPFSLPIVRA